MNGTWPLTCARVVNGTWLFREGASQLILCCSVHQLDILPVLQSCGQTHCSACRKCGCRCTTHAPPNRVQGWRLAVGDGPWLGWTQVGGGPQWFGVDQGWEWTKVGCFLHDRDMVKLRAAVRHDAQDAPLDRATPRPCEPRCDVMYRINRKGGGNGSPGSLCRCQRQRCLRCHVSVIPRTLVCRCRHQRRLRCHVSVPPRALACRRWCQRRLRCHVSVIPRPLVCRRRRQRRFRCHVSRFQRDHSLYSHLSSLRWPAIRLANSKLASL